MAGYPSPGGTTECELDLAAWDRLAAAYPLLGEMAPDVEAIFVNRKEDEVFLIPIDMCYSLVGELRLLWQGFDGGAEVRAPQWPSSWLDCESGRSSMEREH